MPFEYSGCQSYSQGLARSMPTSGALDRVAEKLKLPFFEVNHFSQQIYFPGLQPDKIIRINLLTR